jgi:tripartite-type tricarboxylate transporter receptor subunit TctC
MRFACAVLALSLSAASAPAADYPCAQVRIIVPFAAGGAADVPARFLAERLEASLKKSFVIENRIGATGNIGTAMAATAKPDGCTLLVNGAVIATFPFSFTKLTYDPIKDLVAVGGIGVTPTTIVTAGTSQAKDLKDLLQWSKEKSDGLSFSTAGYGLLQHLAVEEIAQRTGAKFVQVPYKGGAQASTDLVTARVDFGSFATGSVLPLVRDGMLKALAVVQEKRSPLMPNVPTTAEQGLPGMDAGVLFLVFAPAGTSSDIVAMLDAELRKIVSDPSLAERFATIGFDPTPMSSAEATAALRKTGEDWAPVIKRLNIKLD